MFVKTGENHWINLSQCPRIYISYRTARELSPHLGLESGSNFRWQYSREV